MKKRSYQQSCSLAVALDLIGERWTWLLIRALLTGPKRYGQLLEQLPGIGTNLLADRLKSLSGQNIIEKAGSGSQSAYQLTIAGEQLRPITHALVRWGSQFDTGLTEDATRMPQWDMLAIESFLNSVRGPDQTLILNMSLEGHEFHLLLSAQGCRAITGPWLAASTAIETDSGTLAKLARNELQPEDAIEHGLLLVSGRDEFFGVMLDMLRQADHLKNQQASALGL